MNTRDFFMSRNVKRSVKSIGKGKAVLYIQYIAGKNNPEKEGLYRSVSIDVREPSKFH